MSVTPKRFAWVLLAAEQVLASLLMRDPRRTGHHDDGKSSLCRSNVFDRDTGKRTTSFLKRVIGVRDGRMKSIRARADVERITL